MFEEVSKWSEESEYLNVQCTAIEVWNKYAIDDFTSDAILIACSVMLIYLYSLIVLGSCSPIHMRVVSAVIGLCCIGLSILSGYGIAIYTG